MAAGAVDTQEPAVLTFNLAARHLGAILHERHETPLLYVTILGVVSL